MDRLGIFGIALALLAIIGGNALEGGEFEQLLNLPAALIVVGGTIAAAAIQTPAQDFGRALWWLKHLFGDVMPDRYQGLERLTHWCGLARKNGLLGLESQADQESDEFTRAGLQLLIDGSNLESLRASLEIEMISREQRDLKAAKVLDSMGGYAPTLGIVGAVLGLVHVLGNLSQPEELSAGIATAFIATIYGVALANLLLIPLANRIRSIVQARYQYQEMVLEGLLLIADGKTPQALHQRLRGYLV